MPQTNIRITREQLAALQAEWRKLPEPRISFRAWFSLQIEGKVLTNV